MAAQKEAPAVSRARIIVSASAWAMGKRAPRTGAWPPGPSRRPCSRHHSCIVVVVACPVCGPPERGGLGLLSCPCGPPPHSHCGGHHVPAVACHDAHVAPRCCSPIMSQHSRTELQPSWLSLCRLGGGASLTHVCMMWQPSACLVCIVAAALLSRRGRPACVATPAGSLSIDQRTCRAHGCIAVRS